jgi:hypothetical protein
MHVVARFKRKFPVQEVEAGERARSLTHWLSLSLSLSWCVFAARKIRDGDREKALFSMGAKRMPLSPQETASSFSLQQLVLRATASGTFYFLFSCFFEIYQVVC